MALQRLKNFGMRFWITLLGFFILVGSSFTFFTNNYAQDKSIASTPQSTWTITEIARDLDVPWDMAVAPTGDIFVTERRGTIRIINPEHTEHIAIPVPMVKSRGEGGLLGIALHPQFNQNNFLYLFYTYQPNPSQEAVKNRISRFTLTDNTLTDEVLIIDEFPGHVIHNGGRLRFGPDGMLWATTGDASVGGAAQLPTSLAGKILRVRDDGTIPDDNPFPGSPVYSFGHRNPQGLDWHPVTRELIAVEHGDTGYDEVNRIIAGGNYGWPEVRTCDSPAPQFQNPISCGVEGWAPSGGAFIGTQNSDFSNSFFFAGLRGQTLQRMDIVDGIISNQEEIIKETYGRLRAVVSDGNGGLYVSTSNKDGRAKPNPGDDKILNITFNDSVQGRGRRSKHFH